MRYLILGFFSIVFMFAFAGCTKQLPAAQSTQNSQSAQTDATPSPAAKVGQTTKTGQIVKLGDKLYIQEPGQSPLEIDSYNVDLSTYVGKTQTVSGEYSGNTLFVSQVK